jgi:hypothetical protein
VKVFMLIQTRPDGQAVIGRVAAPNIATAKQLFKTSYKAVPCSVICQAPNEKLKPRKVLDVTPVFADPRWQAVSNRWVFIADKRRLPPRRVPILPKKVSRHGRTVSNRPLNKFKAPAHARPIPKRK